MGRRSADYEKGMLQNPFRYATKSSSTYQKVVMRVDAEAHSMRPQQEISEYGNSCLQNVKSKQEDEDIKDGLDDSYFCGGGSDEKKEIKDTFSDRKKPVEDLPFPSLKNATVDPRSQAKSPAKTQTKTFSPLRFRSQRRCLNERSGQADFGVDIMKKETSPLRLGFEI